MLLGSLATGYGLILLTVLLTGGSALAFQGLVAPFVIVVKGTQEILIARDRLRAVLRHDLGAKYIGFFTLFFKLRKAFAWAADQGGLLTRDRLLILASIMSWQEWLCFAALVVWAILAFTPDMFTPGSSWPLVDVRDWVLMQLDWAWGEKWGILKQTFVGGLFSIGCWILLGGWLERRNDLKATAAMRRSYAARTPEEADEMEAAMAHINLRPSDTWTDMESKMGRMRAILAAASDVRSLQEWLLLPTPTLWEFLVTAGFVYGMIYGVLGPRVMSPELHPLVFLVLLPAALPTWLYRALPQGDAVAWVLFLVGLGLAWGAAKLITRAKRTVWDKTYALLHHDELASGRGGKAAATSATAYTKAQLGSYPSTLACLLIWGWFWTCVLVFGVCGYVIIRWVTHTHYLPAYGLPAYGRLDGEAYCGPRACLNSSAWTWAVDAAWQPRGTSGDVLADTAGNATGDFWESWWGDVKIAARLNALAARAWRKSGVDGAHLAMEAVLWASSPDGPAGGEVRKGAVAALRGLQKRGAGLSPYRLSREEALLSSVGRDVSAKKIAKAEVGADRRRTHGSRAGGGGGAWTSEELPSRVPSERSAREAAGSKRGAAQTASCAASGRSASGFEGRAKGPKKAASGPQPVACGPGHDLLAPPNNEREYTECIYETDGGFYRRYWVPDGISWYEYKIDYDEYDVDEYDIDEYDEYDIFDCASRSGGCSETSYDDDDSYDGGFDVLKRWAAKKPDSAPEPKASAANDTKRKAKDKTPTKTSFPPPSGAQSDINWVTIGMLTLVSIAAAFLAVMQPEWTKSPGKFVGAVRGLLAAFARKRKAPHVGPSAGRGSSKTTKQQHPSVGAQKQQNTMLALPAPAAPKTAPAAGAPLAGQASKKGKPEPPAAAASGPAPGHGASGSDAPAVSAPAAAKRPTTCHSRPSVEVNADVARNQTEHQQRCSGDGTVTVSATFAHAPASSGAAGASKARKSKAAAATAAKVVGATAASDTAAKATTGSPPSPEAARSSAAGSPAQPGMTTGSSLASSVAAALAAALPFTASLARQPTAAEQAPASAPSAPAAPASPAPAAAATPAGQRTAAAAPADAAAAAGLVPAARASAAASVAAAANVAPLPKQTVRPLVSTRPAGPTGAAQAAVAPAQPQSSWFKVASGKSAAATTPETAVCASAAAAAPGYAAAAAAASSNGQHAAMSVPVPVSVPKAAPTAAPSPSAPPLQSPAPPPAASLRGLNPALAIALGRLPPAAPHPAPATSQAAGAAAAANSSEGSLTGAMPPPRGGIWGSKPGLHPDLCALCQAARREWCVIHGHTAQVHLCLCTGCAEGFALGSPCPLCGEPVMQRFYFDPTKLKKQAGH